MHEGQLRVTAGMVGDLVAQSSPWAMRRYEVIDPHCTGSRRVVKQIDGTALSDNRSRAVAGRLTAGGDGRRRPEEPALFIAGEALVGGGGESFVSLGVLVET